MKFKVTLHEQVRYSGQLTILRLQSVTQLDTRMKSTMTGTVMSSGRSATAAATAQNEQTAEAHSTLEQQSPERLNHPAWCIVWTVQPASMLKHSEDAESASSECFSIADVNLRQQSGGRSQRGMMVPCR